MIIHTIADFLCDCRLFVRLQIFRFCTISLYKPARFLEDWRISGGFMDNLYDCRLFVQSWIIWAIADYSRNFTDNIRD
jgi:hypothetical protein